MLARQGEVSMKVLAYIELVKVYFAPTQLLDVIPKHVEGCLARNLRGKARELGRFFPDDNYTARGKQIAKTSLAPSLST
jgi:hypothetical protein